jgi:hypothetical protein
VAVWFDRGWAYDAQLPRKYNNDIEHGLRTVSLQGSFQHVKIVLSSQEAIDLVCSPIIDLNIDVQAILTDLDGPYTPSTPDSGAVSTTTFARYPVFPAEIIRGALQACTPLSMFTLLVATSQVVLVEGCSFSQRGLPVLYTEETIKALKIPCLSP